MNINSEKGQTSIEVLDDFLLHSVAMLFVFIIIFIIILVIVVVVFDSVCIISPKLNKKPQHFFYKNKREKTARIKQNIKI